MEIQHFFDPRTSTLTYLVYDEAAGVGVVIDPVHDFDPVSGRLWTESADAVAAFADRAGLAIPFALDTHPHADHLSALPYFRARYGARTVTGSGIIRVQQAFAETFALGPEFRADGRPFDVLLHDGETLDAGPLEIEAWATPGHTPACLSYRIGDAVFVGDTLFQPDYGTARCDFPGGSASELYASIERLYRELPDETRLFTCHDYQPGGRPLAFASTIGEQRASNIQLQDGTVLEAFVALRKARDADLEMPRLFLPSIQVNIRAGELPAPSENGLSYLKIPVNAFGGASA